MGADDIPAKPETVAGNKVEDGILEAARDGNLEQLKKCFNPKVHLSLKGAWKSTPLHIAAENGHVKVVQQLIAWNCDVNAKNVLEYTPLHYAVTGDQSKHADVVAAIAGNEKTKVNEVNKNHCTPLLLASENDQKEMVQILLKYNADPNIPDKNHCTPLLLACENDQEDMVEILLNHKADPNIPDQSENTPLHVAVTNGNYVIADKLLTVQCQKNAQNQAGERPVDIAKKKTGADAAAMVKRIEEEMFAMVPDTIYAEERSVDLPKKMSDAAAVDKRREEELMIEQGLKKEMTREDFLLIRNDAGIIGKDNWKMVFRCLDVDEGDVVEQESKTYSIAEKAYQLFLAWKNKFSKDATLGKFCEVLKGNELNAQADKLRDQIIKSTK